MPASVPRQKRSARAGAELRVGTDFRFDLGRPSRIGAPEVVLGEGKSPEQLIRLLDALHARGRGALVSRPTVAQRRRLVQAARKGLPVSFLAGGRVARLRGEVATAGTPGPVALLAAGTSDVPIAEETRHILEAVGVRVLTAYDVGVAGLHRLLRALRRLERQRPLAYVVYAGREGALPTVVAGLVPAPVIGVPVSTGYGRGGRGEAALLAMLQSCAPIAVVNIDGGIPAALFTLQLLEAGRRLRSSG